MADLHYHEIELPDGSVLTTSPPIGEDNEEGGEVPVDAAEASPPVDPYSAPKRAPEVADEKREYVRDDSGRFATEGAAGAANAALEASTAANALAQTSEGSPEATARRRQLAGQVELAARRARSELGREDPSVRELSAIQSDIGRADRRRLADISQRLGRVNERLAAQSKKEAPVDDVTKAIRAIGDQSLDALPEYGQYVYRSMYDSALRRIGKADDPGGLAFAQGVAWRAVAQAYGLPTSSSHASAKRSSARTPSAVSGMRPPSSRTGHGAFAAKGIVGRPVTADGSFYVVAFSGARGAERYYDRIDNRAIPGSGGAVVRVGIGRPSNTKDILDVRIPKRLVDSTPGGSGAKGWVDRNMDVIQTVAWADVSPLAMVNENVVKGLKRLSLDNCKFVTDMDKASERITYDVAYAPWEIDLQNQYATEAEVQKMAHAYMNHRGTNLMHVTGMTMPDGKAAGEVVESFVAPPGMKEFPRGSWVLGVRWHPEAWERIKRGELTGYSIEGAWGVVPLHRVPELEAVA